MSQKTDKYQPINSKKRPNKWIDQSIIAKQKYINSQRMQRSAPKLTYPSKVTSSHKKPYQNSPLGHTQQRIKPQQIDIQQQLQECDEFSSQSINEDDKIDQKTSFVSNMTQRKRIQKRKKIANYLQQHRNNLPTYRQTSKKQQFTLDSGDEVQRNGNLQNQLQIIQHTQIKNRIFQKFILEFNKNPQKAIKLYLDNHIIKEDTPKSIANYLLKVQGINKNVLGDYFGKNDEKVMAILRAYCDLLGLQEIQFDIALRKILSKFLLPGEAQQIERIVWEFAQSYYEQNKDSYQNAQELFPLAYSIIMLATDAHNPKQQKKMTMDQFVKNTQRACPSFAKQYLQRVYQRIVKQKLYIQKSVYQKLTDIYLTNTKQALGFAQQLKNGTVLWKISLNQRRCCMSFRRQDTCEFYKRKLFLSSDSQRICWVDAGNQEEQPRYIEIKNITDLTVGIAKHLEEKMNIPKQCDNQYFTITTPLRTLDIRTETSKVRSKWMSYLRSVMIQKRQQKIQYLETHYSSVLSRQNLQEIWHSEVFPNWDQHWDYETKKPKQKGFFKQKVQKWCQCFRRPVQNQNNALLGFPIKNSLLETLWGYGLLPGIRKTLWDEIIGNTLQLNQPMIEHIKKNSIYSFKLRAISQNAEIIQTAEFLLTIRPDLPHVKDLLQTSKVFHQVFVSDKNRLISLTNLIYKFHFLPFYKGDRLEIQLRTKLFEFLLGLNVPFVKSHFEAIKLQTKFYLVPWFLSVFSGVFKGDFLLRVWDNFLLEGEIYLFKVGIALIKYFEIELKMCTFYEALKLLKFSNAQKSSLLFFEILDKQINVKSDHYYEYILKRKYAMIKTKIQSIPLG